jgi:hypothetical protein
LAPIWNCERKNKRSMLGKRNTDILEWEKSRWQRTVFLAPALPGLTGAQKQLFGAPAQEVPFSAQRLTGCQNTSDQLARREFLTLLGGAAATWPSSHMSRQERPDRPIN